MQSLEIVMDLLSLVHKNYEVISEEANILLAKMESDLNFQIEEIIIDEIELRDYLVQELKRVRQYLKPSKNTDLLMLEDWDFLDTHFEGIKKDIREGRKEEVAKRLNRGFALVYGFTEESWDAFEELVNFKDMGYKELKFLVYLWSLKRFYRLLKTKLKALNEKKDTPSLISPLQWGETNTTEFLQLTYSLIESGRLTGFEGKKSKIVEALAATLNFPLPKSWPTYLSNSINKQNADYIPPIFEDLKNAYQSHVEKRINKKK